METKVLLRLIKDDIKILENINDSFISQTNLTCEEAEVALARSRALVMEFEMLSKNLSREEEPLLFGETQNAKADEESEKKVRSLRNFLPFIKSEEKPVRPITDHPGSLIEETTVSDEDVISSKEPDTILGNSIANELFSESTGTFSDKEKNGNVVDSKLLQPEVTTQNEDHTAQSNSVPAVESPFEAAPGGNTGAEIPSEKTAEEKKTIGEIPGEKHQLVNDLLSQERTEVKFETRPLKSIRDGIGINDRFLFIRELFLNNSEKYDQTLTALDGLTGIEDAVKYLKQNFKWSKSEAGEKFLLLIKRRFAK